MKLGLISAVPILSALWALPVAAEDNASIHFETADKILTIPQIAGDITIDANFDEPQWQQATKVLLNNVTRPYDNTPSPVYTEARLMADNSTFYLSFIAHDPDPAQIRAYLKDRDRAWGNDIVGVKLDTYNDQRAAYRFLVNALGVQIDGIENEITKKESDSWDGIWSSYGKITDEGYQVEMALPLRMLNFNESDEHQNWGMELMRYYPRDEFLRISNIRLERGNNCEICQLKTVKGFKGAKQGDNLTITPSLVVGASESWDEDVKRWEKEETTEPSIDVRWGITPDVLLNATINPDFSTVETDNAQLNINNSFALFNEEKRPFFLDNADYFSSDYNLIYTRNINAPNIGAKLTGRYDQHSFGLFFTDDNNTNILIPGNRGSAIAEIEDSSKAAGIRYQLNYDDDITLGWISTLRESDDYLNQVHGIDSRWRLTTHDVFKMQYVYSQTEYPDDFYQQFCDADNAIHCKTPELQNCDLTNCDTNEQVLRTLAERPFSGNAFKFSYVHNDEDWMYRASYNRQNSGFRGDLGFMSHIDHNRVVLGVERKWYAQQDSWWTRFNIYSDWDISHNDNNELIEKEFEINANIRAKYDSFLKVGFVHRDQVGNRLDKSSLAIDGNTDLFTENQLDIFAQIKPIAAVYVNAGLLLGDAVDFTNNRLGKINQLSSRFNWNINTHWEMKLKHTFRLLDADGANVFTARLTDLRTTYQFNVRSFIRLSLIYNNTNRNLDNYLYANPEDIITKSRDISTELLYAYKINPQTVFYAGYSDHHDTEDRFSDLEQDQRSIFMKFSYAWLK